MMENVTIRDIKRSTFNIIKGSGDKLLAEFAKHHQLDFLILLTAMAVSRIFVALKYHAVVADLIAANSDWLTWQFLPLEAYRNYPFSSLVYLQETPPIPHLVMEFALAFGGWPARTAGILIAISALLTAATAICLYLLLRRSLAAGFASRPIALAVSLVFGLSTDMVVMEYNSFGQTFYEALAMLLVALICLLFGRAASMPAPKPRLFFAIGLLVALAALSRASFSFYGAVVLPFVLVLALHRGRLKGLAAFLIPIILLHGGWALKNRIVYGYDSIATSSWAGLNFVAGAAKFDSGQDFVSDFLAHSDHEPAWAVELLRRNGPVLWLPLVIDAYLPRALVARERAIQDRLGGTNAPQNTIGVQALGAVYAGFVPVYLRDRPVEMATRFWAAYTLFWTRIADYGSLFVAPFYIAPRQPGVFDLSDRLRPDRQLAMAGYYTVFAADHSHDNPRRIHLGTIGLGAMDALSIWSLHLGLPVVVAIDLYRRVRRRPVLLSLDIYLMIATLAYAIAIYNLVEFGENMRFRLSVEPEILVLTCVVFVRCVTAALAAFGKRRGPDLDIARARARVEPADFR